MTEKGKSQQNEQLIDLHENLVSSSGIFSKRAANDGKKAFNALNPNERNGAASLQPQGEVERRRRGAAAGTAVVRRGHVRHELGHVVVDAAGGVVARARRGEQLHLPDLLLGWRLVDERPALPVTNLLERR